MRIADFFLGRVILSTPQNNAARLLNLCMRHGIAYREPRFDRRRFLVLCNKHESIALKNACQERGIEICIESERGLPRVFAQHKNRYGLAVGLAVALAVLSVSFNTVWSVEVKGNQSLSYGEVVELLEENGFGVGSYLPSADLTLIENRIMNSSKDIAWLSVNIDGTVARVEVREQKSGEEAKRNNAHLVAARDGKIERVEAFDGNCLVKVGDVVREGDLLVCGVYYDENGVSRMTRADGEIFARTVRRFSVEIPYKTTEKIYTGRKKCEIYINFFKKSIKVFSNSGKMHTSCDIIYKNGEVGLSGLKKIPVGYSKTEYLEYEVGERVLSETEAMELAFAEIRERLSELSGNLELLRKNIEFEVNDDAYILKCELVCVENIAAVREIE